MTQGTIAAALVAVLTATGAVATAAAAQQPAAEVPTGELDLGTVRIPRQVLADGKSLAAGTYQLRLTGQEASPEVAGQLQRLNRWVEFVQGGEVRGREVVSIVPQNEIGDVAETPPPGSGSSRVEMLKGNDYLRVWVNREGVHYLVHLPPA